MAKDTVNACMLVYGRSKKAKRIACTKHATRLGVSVEWDHAGIRYMVSPAGIVSAREQR